jgi:NADH:ubiquinone oxidoreductase subunit
MSFLKRIFTWWNVQSYGTQLFTWRKGVKVGEDDQGNVFYETRDGLKRWVIFNDSMEATRVAADWHGWLHHTFKESPVNRPLPKKTWEKPHQENLTGTNMAYAPAGSMRSGAAPAKSDYDAWSPE